jgi:Do/DeqQ family serine protease
MYKYWLLFAQATTIALAGVFVVATFHPDWLTRSWLTRSQQAPPPQVSVATPVPARSAVGSYREAAQRAMPAVVNIFTSQEIRAPRHPLLDDPIFRHFFGQRDESESRRASSLGSGVVVSTDGYVLTNHHVVRAADQIEVAFADGAKYSARLIGSDPESDLAVLRVNADKLPAIRFRATEDVRVGDVVLAIGNPFGVGQTVTMGIVSALGRNRVGATTYENFIQTDAAINPGNSGGALIDASGDLIGINTLIYSRTGGSLGIGFAIPSHNARAVMEQIIAGGSVIRGWIGVEVQELSPELARSFDLPDTRGALIAGVLDGGPAHQAGMRPGDVLLEIAGKPVTDTTAMLNLIAGLKPGTRANFTVFRETQRRQLNVVIGRRPQPRGDEADE